MEIRKFKESDREKKHQMHEKTVRKINSKDYSEDQIEAWTTYEDGGSEKEGWVADQNGDIIGFADYLPDKSKIVGLYVHPDYLRKGIGSKLLEKVEEDAKKRDIEKLKCEASITAKAFYQAQGYRVVEKTVHETSGEELEAYLMEKNFSKETQD